jgi:hypothetical protein
MLFCVLVPIRLFLVAHLYIKENKGNWIVVGEYFDGVYN